MPKKSFFKVIMYNIPVTLAEVSQPVNASDLKIKYYDTEIYFLVN